MSTLTSRFGMLLKRFKQDPVEVCIEDVVRTGEANGNGRPKTNGSPEGRFASESADEHESDARLGLMSRLPGARRDAAIEQLKEGYTQVVDLMQAVRGHMDRQAEFNQRMLQLMEHLPEALAALPETNRNQSRMLEAMIEHFEQEGRRSQQFQQALTAVSAMGQQQAKTMGLMQQQLERSQHQDAHRDQTLHTMQCALEEVSGTSRAGVEALRLISEAADAGQRRLEVAMQSNARHMSIMTGLMIATAIVTAGAVAAITYMVMQVAQ